MKNKPTSTRLACQVFFLITLVISLPSFAQTGNYSQNAGSIYSVNSFTNVTFTSTPLYASGGTLSFQWVACHQPGFGASSLNVELFGGNGFQNIGSYSSALDCIGNSVNLPLSGAQISEAALYGGGNIICRFQISDGCVAGAGCAAINDPAVLGITLTYPYSIADFTVSDTTLCPGQSITFTDITPGTVNSRSWSFPGGTPGTATGATPTITYNTPGAYDVTLTTNGPGGSNTTTKVAVVYVYTPPAAVINASGPVTFCSGGSVTLNANTGAGLTYKWKKGSNNISGATNSSYNATGTGNYKVVVTSTEGCSTTSNTVAVTVNANPTAVITPGGPVDFCPGNSVNLSALGGGGFTFQWKKNGNSIGGATQQSYSANATGNFTCKVTNGNGCSKLSNSIAVTVNTPKAVITLTDPAVFCQGGSALLKANTTPGQTYQWLRNGATLSGQTDSVYTAVISGAYKVIVTNNCGSATSTSKTITVNSLPTASISAGGPTTFCSGSTVTLQANTGTGLNYVWKKNGNTVAGAVNSTYVASTTGSYTVKVTNAAGCSSTSNAIQVTVNSTIATITAGGPTTFCAGDSVILTANSGPGITYQWLKNNVNINGATGQHYTAKTAGTYKVIVTNTATQCAAISSGIAVTVNCRQAGAGGDLTVLSAPNPFTDEITFSFENYAAEKLTLEIYSLSGQLLFKNETQQPENGIKAGHDLSPGIYLVKISQGDRTNEIKVVKQ